MYNDKRLIMKCCYVLILILFFTRPAFGAFYDIGVGARPLGLGGAFVALADDSNASYYNAAGLAYVQDIHLGATYAQRFSGLINYSTIASVLPLGSVGTIGADVGLLSENSRIYSEQTFRFSYARTVIKQFGIGVNIKYFSTSYDATNESVIENPYFADTRSASAISFDIGLMAKPIQNLQLGLSAENLVPADISIATAETDTIPQNIRAGIAYRLASIAELSAQGDAISNVLKNTLAIVELNLRNDVLTTRSGVEIWINNTIAVRGGFGIISDTNSATTVNLGGSAKIPISGTALQIDYGFQLLTGQLQDNTTQRFSINLLF